MLPIVHHYQLNGALVQAVVSYGLIQFLISLLFIVIYLIGVAMIIAKELQDLNNSLDLNKDNVVEMMSKCVSSKKETLNVNYQHDNVNYIFSTFCCTLLHIAARFDCDRIASLLIERGAKIDLQDDDIYKRTPLHYAATCDSIEVAKILIEKGADVNAQSYAEKTPLHCAAQYSNSIKIAKILIAKGANINAQDNFGQTPLYYALENDHLKVAKFLTYKGADRSCIHTISQNKAMHAFNTVFLSIVVTETVVTLGFLGFTIPPSSITVIGAMIAFSISGAAYGVSYLCSQHTLSSKLGEVECTNATHHLLLSV